MARGFCAATMPLVNGEVDVPCPGRGVFVVIGDVLGALALFVMLFGIASFGG